MKPYDKFDVQCKELLSLFDKPILLIDRQIKEFDEARKEEKRAKIKQAYAEIAAGFEDFLPLSRIYDAKWENATTSMKSIKDSLMEMVKSVRTALDSIKAMHSECEGRAIEEYKKNLSLSDAMTYITQYEKQKAEILIREQQRQREEAERVRQAEIKRLLKLKDAKVIQEQCPNQIRRSANQNRCLLMIFGHRTIANLVTSCRLPARQDSQSNLHSHCCAGRSGTSRDGI